MNAASTRPVTWVRVGTLLNGESTAPLRDAHLVFSAEEILHVGTAPPPVAIRADLEAPLDLPQCTALPGLIEAHAHLFLEGEELDAEKRKAYQASSPDELLAAAQGRLYRLVQIGVMAVRDAGDKDGVGLALSRQYRQRTREDAIMPYLDSPGAAIHRAGRYGKFMGEPLEACDSPAACVRQRVAAGADRIKLIPTGIINFKQGAVTAAPQMSAEDVAALVAAARSLNKQTFAHASGADGIENAIRGGVDSIEHGFFVTREQLAYMRDHDIAWVPTLAPVHKQIEHADVMGWDETVVGHLRRIVDQHAASLAYAHEIGVRIIAGSDAGSWGVGHGFGFIHELELMGRAGLSPLTVLNAATGTSSVRLGFHEKIGVLKAGYKPRIIFTEHNPLQSVRNLNREKACVFDGHVILPNGEVDRTGL